MFKIWFSLALVFSLQEIASTAAALLTAQHLTLDIWLVHALWLLVITSEVALSFAIGAFVKQKFATSRPALWAHRLADRWEDGGVISKEFTLFILNFLNFPFPTAFIAPWFGISFTTFFIWAMAGNIAWYLLEWTIVLGVAAWAPDFMTALTVVVAIGIGMTILIFALRKNTGIMR